MCYVSHWDDMLSVRLNESQFVISIFSDDVKLNDLRILGIISWYFG